MNLAGKFLTFLILFMSIVFLVLAIVTGASHREWKKIASLNKQRADTAERLLNEAKERTSQGARLLEAEATSRQQFIAHLNSELVKERENREQKERELTELTAMVQTQLTNLENAEKRIANQDTEMAQLREQNKNLIDEIGTRRVEVTTLTNEVFSLRGTLDELKSRAEGLNEQLAKATKVLKANGLNENSLTDSIAPRLEALVMKTEGELAIVSAGTDDGLRVGHIIDIYRGDRFVAKGRVVNAEYNMAAARILSEYRQAAVQEGDIVTTKF